MGLTEQEIKKDVERARAYQQMFDMWAWKDFKSFLGALKESTVSDFISLDHSEGVEFKAGQLNGILDCLSRIERELDYATSPNDA